MNNLKRKLQFSCDLLQTVFKLKKKKNYKVYFHNSINLIYFKHKNRLIQEYYKYK